jgi:hypothetical protein
VASVTCSLVRTPFGVYPQECVHKVPSGSRVVTTDEKTVVSHPTGDSWVVPECKVSGSQEKRQFPPNYDGWLAYTSYQTTFPSFDTFLGSFTVPNNPRVYLHRNSCSLFRERSRSSVHLHWSAERRLDPESRSPSFYFRYHPTRPPVSR